MKPDWKDAPEWAKFLACDEGGSWFWYECQPKISGDEWYSKTGKYEQITHGVSWDSSLETRPAAIGESCER